MSFLNEMNRARHLAGLKPISEDLGDDFESLDEAAKTSVLSKRNKELQQNGMNKAAEKASTKNSTVGGKGGKAVKDTDALLGDAEFESAWKGLSKETQGAFGHSMPGYVAYQKGEYMAMTKKK